MTFEQEFENAEKKFKAKMEEEQAKAVELHEEKRAGEKKCEQVDERKCEQVDERKREEENKGEEQDDRKRADEKKCEQTERDEEHDEKRRSEKEKSRKESEDIQTTLLPLLPNSHPSSPKIFDHLCSCSSFMPLTSPANLLIMSRGMLKSTWDKTFVFGKFS